MKNLFHRLRSNRDWELKIMEMGISRKRNRLHSAIVTLKKHTFNHTNQMEAQEMLILRLYSQQGQICFFGSFCSIIWNQFFFAKLIKLKLLTIDFVRLMFYFRIFSSKNLSGFSPFAIDIRIKNFTLCIRSQFAKQFIIKQLPVENE